MKCVNRNDFEIRIEWKEIQASLRVKRKISPHQSNPSRQNSFGCFDPSKLHKDPLLYAMNGNRKVKLVT
jgi:hypothetical protein